MRTDVFKDLPRSGLTIVTTRQPAAGLSSLLLQVAVETSYERPVVYVSDEAKMPNFVPRLTMNLAGKDASFEQCRQALSDYSKAVGSNFTLGHAPDILEYTNGYEAERPQVIVFDALRLAHVDKSTILDTVKRLHARSAALIIGMPLRVWPKVEPLADTADALMDASDLVFHLTADWQKRSAEFTQIKSGTARYVQHLAIDIGRMAFTRPEVSNG